VSADEFQQQQAPTLFQAQNTFYQTERKALEAFLDQYLLEEAAKKENVTVDELLKRHVTSKVPADPGEEALKLYYEATESKESWDKMRPLIIDHIRETRSAKIKADYMASLRNQAHVIVRLAPPRAEVSMKDTPARGPADAAVRIVEFADYECPYCQQMQPTLDKIEADYKGKVQFAFKDMPLPMHPHAEKAAEAARCAGAQGKYWEYHDRLFQGKQLEVAQMKESARALNMDGKAFDECLDGNKQADAVKAQGNQAADLQLTGTPSFFINGRFYAGGMDYDSLRQIVEEELSATKQQAVAQVTH
jgi:protein-disulfide isomerase